MGIFNRILGLSRILLAGCATVKSDPVDADSSAQSDACHNENGPEPSLEDAFETDSEAGSNTLTEHL